MRSTMWILCPYYVDFVSPGAPGSCILLEEEECVKTQVEKGAGPAQPSTCQIHVGFDIHTNKSCFGMPPAHCDKVKH